MCFWRCKFVTFYLFPLIRVQLNYFHFCGISLIQEQGNQICFLDSGITEQQSPTVNFLKKKKSKISKTENKKLKINKLKKTHFKQSILKLVKRFKTNLNCRKLISICLIKIQSEKIHSTDYKEIQMLKVKKNNLVWLGLINFKVLKNISNVSLSFLFWNKIHF